MEEKKPDHRPPHSPGSIEKAWHQAEDDGAPPSETAEEAEKRRAQAREAKEPPRDTK